MDGMDRNLNHEKFYTRFAPPPQHGSKE
jgi:hypothetical protein